MSEYTLFTIIIMSILGFMWTTNSLLNVIVKVMLFGLVVYGLYLMFGPTDLITKFA